MGFQFGSKLSEGFLDLPGQMGLGHVDRGMEIGIAESGDRGNGLAESYGIAQQERLAVQEDGCGQFLVLARGQEHVKTCRGHLMVHKAMKISGALTTSLRDTVDPVEALALEGKAFHEGIELDAIARRRADGERGRGLVIRAGELFFEGMYRRVRILFQRDGDSGVVLRCIDYPAVFHARSLAIRARMTPQQ